MGRSKCDMIQNVRIMSELRQVHVGLLMAPPLRLTQHKRFVPNGTHPNFCFAKTSFMLGTLCEMPPHKKDKDKEKSYKKI